MPYREMKSLNTYDGPVPGGVVNPFTVMRHAYPTRYHGPSYERMMYRLPWVTRPYDFAVERGTEGLGVDPAADPNAPPTSLGTASPPAWKWAVGLSLAALTIWAAAAVAGHGAEVGAARARGHA
jgi:hypothetical protein